MGSGEKFGLRWNDFEANISSAFHELKEEKDFTDVTLACADNQVEAHKVILAASSPFFKSILKNNPHIHPLIYLKGIKSSDVEAVLNFIYLGEVNIEEADLKTFLEVAEDLEVKGLVPEKDHESASGIQSQFTRTNIQYPNSRSTKQSSAQMYDQLFSNIMQAFHTSDNHSTSEAVLVKVEEEESLIKDVNTAPVLEVMHQQNDANPKSLKYHQEQCSQILLDFQREKLIVIFHSFSLFNLQQTLID